MIILCRYYKPFPTCDYTILISNFILQTKACDLHTKLALGMKRNMIQALHNGCPAWSDEPDTQQNVLSKYKKYGDQVNI